MFEAVILAGGFGTRLKSVTGDIPKPMVEVNGTPFLYRLMKKLESQGCSHIILSIGYRSDYFIERINKDKPVNCRVSFAIETAPLGTGGGIKNAATYVSGNNFIVLNGDTYCELDYQAFSSFSFKSRLSISGIKVGDTSRYGTLSVDEGNMLNKLNEKGATGRGVINGGIYGVNRNDILAFSQDSFSFEKDFIPQFYGQAAVYICDGYFIDIGVPEDYFIACKELK